MRSRSKYLLRGGLEVGLFCLEDVRDKTLRIAIDHRKPRALHLDHDPVPTLERVVIRRKSDLVVLNRVCDQRFRLLETLQISRAKYVTGNHELITTHRR